MTRKLFTRSIAAFGMALVVGVVAVGNTALAHVTVKPSEVVTAGYQIFTIGVPNERDSATVSVKLLIPSAITSATPTQKAGWTVVKEMSGEGDAAVPVSITWQGGAIGVGLRDEFTFSAKVPGDASELQWKAYQTYADGTVVSWDQATTDHGHEGDTNLGPFSVTKVVTASAQDMAIETALENAAAAKTAADRALYIALVALVVAIIGIFLGTRRNR